MGHCFEKRWGTITTEGRKVPHIPSKPRLTCIVMPPHFPSESVPHFARNPQIEIGMFAQQCLGKRPIPSLKILREEARAWNRRVNRDRVKINWKFDRKAAGSNLATKGTLSSGQRPSRPLKSGGGVSKGRRAACFLGGPLGWKRQILVLIPGWRLRPVDDDNLHRALRGFKL